MRVLISGITGQDGVYLAQHLIDAGCDVWGTSRRGADGDFTRLDAVGVRQKINVEQMDPADAASVNATLNRLRPSAIVNLAGQSSVAASFDDPAETLRASVSGTVNILEWVRRHAPATRVVSAGSGDCFGDTGEEPARETTHFAPRSPYAIGKCGAANFTRLYRAAYGLSVCTAFLFNHESPLRSHKFVTYKVVSAAIRIRASRAGFSQPLELGALDMVRDWGWAPEYMEAVARMVRRPEVHDMLIATGTSMSLQSFVSAVFAEAGLDWREHVVQRDSLRRPLDIGISRACPARAETDLGWRALTRGEAVPRRLFNEVSDIMSRGPRDHVQAQ